jgi:hypothetical protein
MILKSIFMITGIIVVLASGVVAVCAYCGDQIEELQHAGVDPTKRYVPQFAAKGLVTDDCEYASCMTADLVRLAGGLRQAEPVKVSKASGRCPQLIH